MVSVIVAVFVAKSLTVSEMNTETMLLRLLNQAPRTSLLAIEAARQIYRQVL